jgi:hypothetical protein
MFSKTVMWRKQRIVLEHEADAAFLDRRMARLLTVDIDFPEIGEFQPRDNAQ